jgi:hypothetical protein
MSQSTKGDSRFALVIFLSFALGMAVALTVFLVWRSQGGNLQPSTTAMALAVCPPFVLSSVIAATPEAAFALVLGVGTILFANGFLYAGVAAGVYFLITLRGRKRGV